MLLQVPSKPVNFPLDLSNFLLAAGVPVAAATPQQGD
jgi:hypothetical protein